MRVPFNFRIKIHYLQILDSQMESITNGGIFMKATGITRKIDELGRIVIPKEIRRTLRIREGTPLQTILTDDMLENLNKKDNKWINILNLIQLAERLEGTY